MNKKRKMRSSAFFSLVVLLLLAILLLQFWVFEVFSPLIKMIVSVLIIILGLAFAAYVSKKEQKKPSKRLIKNFVAIGLAGVLTYTNIFYFQTNLVLIKVMTSSQDKQTVQLITLKNNGIKSLSALKGKNIGFQSLDPLYGHLNVIESLETYNKWSAGIDFTETIYGTYSEAISALSSGEIDAMVVNLNDYKDIKKEHPDILVKTVVLKEFSFKVADISNRVNIAKESFNVLVTGTDNREGEFDESTRTDSVIVASINPRTMETYLISLPRDLIIPVSCKGGLEDKLTHVNNLGIECLQASVEAFLEIKINYYVEFNFDSLIKTVDLLGGVEVDVQYPFCELDSHDQYDAICLETGLQVLKGEQALAYARHRRTVDDYHRGNAQRQIIEAIAKKMATVEGFKKFSTILSSVASDITTNFSRKEIYEGISLLSKAGSIQITQQMIEGEGIDGYYIELQDYYAFGHVADQEALQTLKQALVDLAKRNPPEK